jgi:regulator of RNase E activity RraB
MLGAAVNTSLPWRFTFTDEDRGRLESLAKHMTEIGYQVDGEILNQDEDSPLLELAVERSEVHSIESLHSRTVELTQLASQYGVELDSWGVERWPIKKHWWEFLK